MKSPILLPIFGRASLLPEYIRRVTTGPWNPDLPPKDWVDTRPELPLFIAYDYPVTVGVSGIQTVEIQKFSLSRKWAQTANVPPSSLPEGVTLEPGVPWPMRALYEDEELFIYGPFGIYVRNTTLYAQFSGTPAPAPQVDLGAVVAKLDWIISALKAAGLGG